MHQENAQPWWKFGYVWLIIAGPLTVVVASIITVAYAIRVPDPAIEDYYVKGQNINQTLAAQKMAPAVKGRNHAATGVRD